MGAAHYPQDRFSVSADRGVAGRADIARTDGPRRSRSHLGGAYLHTLNVLHVPYDNPGRMGDIGNDVCQQARGGVDFDAIYPTVASNGYASAEAGQIMGADVGAFCPDMEGPFDRWTND